MIKLMSEYISGNAKNFYSKYVTRKGGQVDIRLDFPCNIRVLFPYGYYEKIKSKVEQPQSRETPTT